MKPTQIDEQAMEAGVAAYLTTVGSYAPLRPDLHTASAEQLAEGLRACVGAYLASILAPIPFSGQNGARRDRPRSAR
jgi:hypothetical protein